MASAVDVLARHEIQVTEDQILRHVSWDRGSLTLITWDTYRHDRSHWSGTRCGWALLSGRGKRQFVLNQGDSYGPASGQSLDSDAAVWGLLSFLVLQPGDTDADYFCDHSQDFKDWAMSDQRDRLAMLVDNYENFAEYRREYGSEVKRPKLHNVK